MGPTEAIAIFVTRTASEDIPPEVRDQLEFIWLEQVEEAVAASLETAEEAVRLEVGRQTGATAAA